MKNFSIPLILFSAVLFGHDQPEVATSDPSPSLADLAARYCLDTDGDHRLTWHRVEQDGFRALEPQEFENLRLLGSNGDTIRGFTKEADGRILRVLTAASWIQGSDDGRTHFRFCWVSGPGENLGEVNRDLVRDLGGRSFRAEKTFVYAWIPRPGGSVEFVPRRVFMRQGLTLARDQGMRQVTVREYGESVFVGYASPRDEATYREFDWSGPDPINTPR